MRVLAMVLGVLVSLCMPFAAHSTTWYVIQDGSGDATTIQAGIDLAAVGDTVLVAAGTYTGPGNKNLDFGGRDIVLQSEAGAEVTIIDCEGSGRGLYFHSGESAAAVVEGLTVTNGYDDLTGGGGVLCDRGSSPTLIDCAFSGNYGSEGGGMCCLLSSPALIRCLFSENSSDSYFGGGGMQCNTSSPTLTDCVFLNNTAMTGGGMYCTNGAVVPPPTLVHCTFSNNLASEGGGMYCLHGNPIVTECSFSGNSATNCGGAVFCLEDEFPYGPPSFKSCVFSQNCASRGGGAYLEHSIARFTNSTFCGNAAAEGGAVYCYSSTEPYSPTLDNAIIAFSAQGEALYCSGICSPALTCCDVYGNAGGDWTGCIADQYGVRGNISSDPLFCDAENHDFTIADVSPCAPDNSPLGCGLIGALPVACSLGPVEATVDVDPNTLNLKSEGKYATTYIELPEGCDPLDIDVSTVLFNGVLPAVAAPTAVADYDSDGVAERMVKFNRSGVIGLLSGSEGSRWWLEERGGNTAPLRHGEEFEVTVSGELEDGTPFLGTDVIRVINPGGGSDGALVLEVYPSPLDKMATISFELPLEGPVKLCIYDVAGRLVRRLLEGQRAAGRHEVTWDRRTDGGWQVNAGVYFVRLEKQGGAVVEKVLVVR